MSDYLKEAKEYYHHATAAQPDQNTGLLTAIAAALIALAEQGQRQKDTAFELDCLRERVKALEQPAPAEPQGQGQHKACSLCHHPALLIHVRDDMYYVDCTWCENSGNVKDTPDLAWADWDKDN